MNLNFGSLMDKYYFTLNVGHKEADYYGLSKDFEHTTNIPGDRMPNSDYSQSYMSFKTGFVPKQGQEYALGYNKVTNDLGLPLTLTSVVSLKYLE